MKVAERKQYRELKEDIANYPFIDHKSQEQHDTEVYSACLITCNVEGATHDLNEFSAVTFDLQYSYSEQSDESTGCHDSSQSVEIQLKEVTDREGNIIALKENQKHEIEKLLEEKVEI